MQLLPRTYWLAFVAVLIVLPSLSLSQTPDERSETLSGSLTATDHQDPTAQNVKLAAYSQFRNVWRFASLAIRITVLLGIIMTGLAVRLRDISAHIKNRFFSLWAFVAMLLIADHLIRLPVIIFRSYLVENYFCFVTQSFTSWLLRDLTGLLVTTLIAIIPIWLLYYTIRHYRRWWLAFTVSIAPIIVLGTALAPVLVDPLFNDFKTMSDKQTETEILALAETAGIDRADVFVVDASQQSTRINAYVTGLLGSSRIVLYDNLLNKFERDEVRLVMAHEMAHYVKHHVWWGIGVAVLFIGLCFWLTAQLLPWCLTRFRRWKLVDVSDRTALPLIIAVLTVLSFVLQPLHNIPSRFMERQADQFALQVADVSLDRAVGSYEKLSEYNLSDPDPHPMFEFWFYSHPSLSKRIESARRFYAASDK